LAAPEKGEMLPPGIVREQDGSVSFEILQGESARSVGERLQRADLIRSSLLWTLVARLDSEPLKAGLFRILPPLSMLSIRELLVSDDQLLFRVTVPEGFTLSKTARLLEANGICAAADFLAATEAKDTLEAFGIPAATMEGYLYPDTYLLPKGYPADKVVSLMADTFRARVADLAPESAALSSEETFRRIVIASIVEREYRASDEAPLMAGVFFNRLRIGMALQSCATVEYVITEKLGKPHPEILSFTDIAIADPYNTYIRAGLPPGPICAPGAVALAAAFRPAASDYLYFRLVDPAEGRHRFSRTLGEHAAASVIFVKRSASGS